MMAGRTYYRFIIELESALSIGGADSVETDRDIVLDSRGLPLIPASSICGVMRSLFSRGDAERIFGFIHEDEQIESSIRVFDFAHCGGNEAVSVRDSVALEDKVAKDGAKFDRQIVERGARFEGFFEVLDEARCSEADLAIMISSLSAHTVTLGAKSSRGFGQISLLECKRKTFDLPADRDAWLGFDMFEDDEWSEAEIVTPGAVEGSGLVFELALEQRGAVSIREYYTTPREADFGQMTIRNENFNCLSGETPVIPGTSWAGAFRERYVQFSSKEEADSLFGYVNPQDNSQKKSLISFSESELAGGEWKEVTRNSIDRFTGGTKDGALFTELGYFKGETDLIIRISAEGLRSGAQIVAPLIATIADLHNGFLAVGGLTAVGHGLFRITSANLMVNGCEIESFESKLLGEGSQALIRPNVGCIVEAIDAALRGGKSA